MYDIDNAFKIKRIKTKIQVTCEADCTLYIPKHTLLCTNELMNNDFFLMIWFQISLLKLKVSSTDN